MSGNRLAAYSCSPLYLQLRLDMNTQLEQFSLAKFGCSIKTLNPPIDLNGISKYNELKDLG